MANSSYQISSTPKLYISWPLYTYTLGYGNFTILPFPTPDDNMELMDLFEPHTNPLHGSLYLDPAKTTDILFTDTYRTMKWHYATEVLDNTDWFNFDFCGFLNHNFKEANIKPSIYGSTGAGNNPLELTTSNIVNHIPGAVPEYDGWSLLNIDDIPDADKATLGVHFTKDDPEDGPILTNDGYVGSVFFGKSYEFPQNTDLNTTVKFNYGIKQQKTISGKTISTANWYRPNKWNNFEPFGLGSIADGSEYETGVHYNRRNGLRTWTMQFSSLATDKVMPQNMMTNDNNYTLQGNHEEGAVDGSSKYNISSSPDFYSRVVRLLMANHLPCILQIDKNDNSPSGFAIVRMNKDYQITQKSPNLYNIKVSFTEQI